MNVKEQHILFILDRSGSMSARQRDVIGGFNTYTAEMKKEAATDGMATFVSLVTFAYSHSIVFAGKPVAEVGALTESDYRTMGNTALLDAVHDSVSKYREKVGQGTFSAGNPNAPAVLVIVFTDGAENASTHASWQDVQTLVQECEALGNWTFTYVGAHPAAWAQAGQLRLKEGNVLDASIMTVNEVTERLVTSAREHRYAYRDHDQKSSEDLFKPDAS